MKYILILGDGMADKGVEALNGLTPLEQADTPYFDYLAANGCNGLLQTIPEGFPPGSEVGNLSILGYDIKDCFEGRGPLEAAAMGYDMEPDDLAMRCNIIATDDSGNILNHHGNNLTSEEAEVLINFLNEKLGDDNFHFYPGIQYRHLLIIKEGIKDLYLFPPHDHVGENTQSLINKTLELCKVKQSEGTAKKLMSLVEKSRPILESHPINKRRAVEGKGMANMIWPWSEGYRPKMKPLSSRFPSINGGAMITAVDLLKGIGKYAGLKPIEVEGATGRADTNYEGKAKAAIEALKDNDFVFIHVEATDEASHDRDVSLKLKTIEYLDQRILKPILEETVFKGIPVKIALLPDHLTSVETGKHLSDPVPFVIYGQGIRPDKVTLFDEINCRKGGYGFLKPTEFIKKFLEE